jgi:AcrR family transcriptional regulator
MLPEAKAALNTKEEILKAAIEFFAQKGIKGTTTRDIVSRANVNIASLHYHWGGKDDLVTAVYQRIMDEVAAMAMNVFQNETENLKDAITHHLGHFYDFFIENPEYPRLLTYIDLEEPPACAELNQQYMVPIIQQTIAELKRLIKEGKIRKVDPEITLFSLYGMILIPFSDLQCQKKIMGEAMPAPKIAQRFKKQFLETVLLTLGLPHRASGAPGS